MRYRSGKKTRTFIFYLTFSLRFERIWLKSKKHLLGYAAEKPADIGLRSQYALYGWTKHYVTVGQNLGAQPHG
jgi:hypothetical protein